MCLLSPRSGRHGELAALKPARQKPRSNLPKPRLAIAKVGPKMAMLRLRSGRISRIDFPSKVSPQRPVCAS